MDKDILGKFGKKRKSLFNKFDKDKYAYIDEEDKAYKEKEEMWLNEERF